ncbi:MAG: hypothetical protein WD740_07475 [Anaerolineales bacterium]
MPKSLKMVTGIQVPLRHTACPHLILGEKRGASQPEDWATLVPFVPY